MRRDVAEGLAPAGDEELLTTGEAARILGLSRQRVVELCRSGDLPYSTVGTHRRVLRSDVDQLRDVRQRMTRDQRRSLALGYLVAARLVSDPVATLRIARSNLHHMRAASPRGSARVWLDEWDKLLEGPISRTLDTLTSRTQRARELRQNSPFAGVLTEQERESAAAMADLIEKPGPA